MAQSPVPVNSIAPLRNVALLSGMVERLSARQDGEPGIGVFYGPPGWGKTIAKIFSVNKHEAYGVQADDTWTKKVMCEEILRNMGIAPAGTIAEMVRQIATQLAKSRRPLIIDEADFVVKKSLIETIRTIYEMSLAPIVLIGEANIPNKLRKWERVFSRILEWTKAVPLELSDGRQLAKIYARDIEIGDELLKLLFDRANVDGTGTSARRFVTGLSAIRIQAQRSGKKRMAGDDFKGEFFPGLPKPGETFFVAGVK